MIIIQMLNQIVNQVQFVSLAPSILALCAAFKIIFGLNSYNN